MLNKVSNNFSKSFVNYSFLFPTQIHYHGQNDYHFWRDDYSLRGWYVLTRSKRDKKDSTRKNKRENEMRLTLALLGNQTLIYNLHKHLHFHNLKPKLLKPVHYHAPTVRKPKRASVRRFLRWTVQLILFSMFANVAKSVPRPRVKSVAVPMG